MEFGLATEGVTDQPVITNILCGYFSEIEDMDDEINPCQPGFDETNKKQIGFGNWTLLLEYLITTRFRDDVLNYKYLVVQIDTDVSQDYEVAHTDDQNQPLIVEKIYENVAKRLIDKINEGDPEFYNQHGSRIIFCITVHSIECWLNAYYHHNAHKWTNPKITGCERSLEQTLKTQGKDYQKTWEVYNELSQPFLDALVIQEISKRQPSLRLFIENLDSIKEQVRKDLSN